VLEKMQLHLPVRAMIAVGAICAACAMIASDAVFAIRVMVFVCGRPEISH
jgi:hypothetical protein